MNQKLIFTFLVSFLKIIGLEYFIKALHLVIHLGIVLDHHLHILVQDNNSNTVTLHQAKTLINLIKLYA